MITEMRAEGEVVWESRSTYLARHRTQGRMPAPAPSDETAKPLPAVAEWRLAGDIGRRYGAASGDRNPIHLHPLTARLFGFPRAIAHGMWTVARCLAAHGTPERPGWGGVQGAGAAAGERDVRGGRGAVRAARGRGPRPRERAGDTPDRLNRLSPGGR